MYIIICEDEPFFANELQGELAAFFRQKEIECRLRYCRSGAELRSALAEDTSVDLLFMDIHLGDADGVELIKEMNTQSMRIPTVFLSSLEDRIADGYDVRAFHFLFKRNYKEKLPGILETFLQDILKNRTILLQNHDETVLLHFDDIYYVEADKRVTAIHTAISCYQEKQSIQSFAKDLPAEQFVEAYHSLYINIDHIRKVSMDTIRLDNDKELPVSRRKRKTVMSAVMRRLRSR